jgi:hypothetical protein
MVTLNVKKEKRQVYFLAGVEGRELNIARVPERSDHGLAHCSKWQGILVEYQGFLETSALDPRKPL